MECYRQGLPIAQIAQQVHLARATVYKYLAAESFPERAPRSASAGTGKLLAPYTSYLRQRCEAGCQNAQQLYREIHAQGFSGNPRTVLRGLQAQGLFPRRYELRQALDTWDHPVEKKPQSTSARKEGQAATVPASQEPSCPVELTEPLASARQLSSLFVKDPSRLQAKDQPVLAFIQQDREIELAYRMSQQLIHLLKSRQGETALPGSAFVPRAAFRSWKRLPLAYKKSSPLFKLPVLFPTTME